MKPLFLLVAVAATVTLQACAGAAPTGPESPAMIPSLNLVDSATAATSPVPIRVDTSQTPCPVEQKDTTDTSPLTVAAPSDTTGTLQVASQGTYAVAYGGRCVTPG